MILEERKLVFLFIIKMIEKQCLKNRVPNKPVKKTCNTSAEKGIDGQILKQIINLIFMMHHLHANDKIILNLNIE